MQLRPAPNTSRKPHYRYDWIDGVMRPCCTEARRTLGVAIMERPRSIPWATRRMYWSTMVQGEPG